MKSAKWKTHLRYLCLQSLILFFGTHGAGADGGEDISLEGGATTIKDNGENSYDHSLANIHNKNELLRHELGREGFRRDFARTPIRGTVRIGPKFNNVSCVGCHQNNGRGNPEFTRHASQSVVKISKASGNSVVPGGPFPVGALGLQLRDHATKGVTPDGKVYLSWKHLHGYYPDGTSYALRKPLLSIRRTKLPRSAMFSLRRPPPIFGMGLLDAIPSSKIASLADPNDSNRDGISGKANVVWDIDRQAKVIGKFGWKATSPSVSQQVATAYAIDMGVTNPLIPLGAINPDIDQQSLSGTIFYNQTLAVPAARAQTSQLVQRGKNLFISHNCNGCHVMTLDTGKYPLKELSNQRIHPFTDLLLHDMGQELADNRPEFEASGSEWRTPPLWGIGLTAKVLTRGEENYLHDGRARSIEEAILWHGGESESAKQSFLSSQAEDRQALITFLRSL